MLNFCMRERFEILVGYFQTLAPGNFWLPAQYAFSFGYIRAALFGIICRQRQADQFLIRAGQFNNFLTKLAYSDLIRVANIYRLCIIAEQQAVNTFYQVIYITE